MINFSKRFWGVSAKKRGYSLILSFSFKCMTFVHRYLRRVFKGSPPLCLSPTAGSTCVKSQRSQSWEWRKTTSPIFTQGHLYSAKALKGPSMKMLGRNLCSSTSKSPPSFSRRLFSSDKEGLDNMRKGRVSAK